MINKILSKNKGKLRKTARKRYQNLTVEEKQKTVKYMKN